MPAGIGATVSPKMNSGSWVGGGTVGSGARLEVAVPSGAGAGCERARMPVNPSEGRCLGPP